MDQLFEQIEELYEKIESKGININELPKQYVKLFENIGNEKLKFLFSYYHFNLNEEFKALNSRTFKRSPANTHFWADHSRNLFNLINDVIELEKDSKNTDLSFSIEKSYKDKFLELLKILQLSGGTVLPEYLEEAKIIRTKPIFISDDSISVSLNNSKINLKIKLIGEGSYGQVFKYKDLNYNKYFAIKRLLPNVTEKEKTRFIQEFNIMNKLKHPFIIEVFKINTEDNEYSMELADMSLDKYIKENNNKLSLDERKSISYKIISTINFINEKNYYHRDISPKNILIKKYDSIIFPKISDFGLVKIPNSNLTSLNTNMKGSYNDPDLIRMGFNEYSLTHEIYALTRVIVFIITGKETIHNIDKKTEIYAFLQKGIDYDKKNRFQNTQELLEALKKIKE